MKTNSIPTVLSSIDYQLVDCVDTIDSVDNCEHPDEDQQLLFEQELVITNVGNILSSKSIDVAKFKGEFVCKFYFFLFECVLCKPIIGIISPPPNL